MVTVDLPERLVLFDTEFTSWEGAKDAGWSLPGQMREIVQIAGVKVVGKGLKIEDEFEAVILPRVNPKLSDFLVELTGLTQERVDKEGRDLMEVLGEFVAWSEDLPLYCYGVDGRVIAENCWEYGVESPLPAERFFNVRAVVEAAGVDSTKYTSGSLPRAVGAEPSRRAHDALNDVKNMREGLVLLAKGVT